MYDDHEYCEKCTKHSVQCWCKPMEDNWESPDRLCTEHDWITGESLVAQLG